MADLPLLAGGPGETGANPGGSGGVTITANASANTKATTWTQLIASTAYTSDWLLVTLQAENTVASYLTDIGIGGSTAEMVLIPDLYTHPAVVTQVVSRYFLFPLHIPAGTRLSARCQSDVGGSTIQVAVTPIASPIGAPEGFGRVEGLGIVSASSQGTDLNDPGSVVNTDGTWTTLLTSTGFPYSWLVVTAANELILAYTLGTRNLIDIGVGGAGAEVVLAPDLFTVINTALDSPLQTWYFPVAIPAGTRVVARHRSSSSTAGERRITLAAYGVG